MEKNLVKHNKTNLNGVVWKAATCAKKADFDDYIATVRAANPAAADYISAIPAEKCARSHFGAARFGHLTSNMAESTNSWLEDARHLPPTQLFACFVRSVKCSSSGAARSTTRCPQTLSRAALQLSLQRPSTRADI